MGVDLEQIYNRLYAWAEQRNFAGSDPFDGLNSRLFQRSPLKHSRFARLAWLQMLKRLPLDLRPLLLVDNGVNPKALALFALAELSRYRNTSSEDHARKARDLIDRMLELAIRGDDWTAFGYNFDWQSRVFFVPKGTPAIVPTAFALQALVEAHEAFGGKQYLETADEICKFILSKLDRPVETDDEICFSYTPVDQTMIYNASLLAGECLARVGAIKHSEEYLTIAAKTVRFVVRRQRTEGAWGYGEEGKQAWVDNFHTAYVLLSLKRIADRVPDIKSGVAEAIERGKKYWMENLFMPNGMPKYYDKATYPVDIHSAAVAIGALAELGEVENSHKVAAWTMRNMLDTDGFFYYRVGRVAVNQTAFMRWGQAWMAHALARLMEVEG